MRKLDAVEAVVFDMDGVLVDSEILNTEHFVGYFANKGLHLDRSVPLSLVGGSGDSFWGTMRDAAGLDMDLAAMRLEMLEYFRTRDIRYRDYMTPGADALLKRLKECGFKLALASATERDRVGRVVEQCGFGEYLDVILTGDMFRECKPNPEIYLTSADRLGVDPARCLAVEDSPVGIQAALAAGMTVAAKRETRFAHFDQSKAHFILESLTDLAELL